MNSSDQSLLKGIRIFFKTVYIVLIVFYCIIVLSQGLLYIVDTEKIASLSILYQFHEPAVSLSLGGEVKEPVMLLGMGAVVMKDIPLSLRISNTLLMLAGMFLYILIIRTIRLIIRSMDNNEVFSLKNARYLKHIGLFLVANLVLTYAVSLSNSLALHSFDGSNIASLLGFIVGDALGYIIAIVFIFFMAAVFRIGVSIQEENRSFV
jgi:hypothetical protein